MYYKEFTYWKLNSCFGVCSSIPSCQFFCLLLSYVGQNQAGLLLNDLQDSCVKLIGTTDVSEMVLDLVLNTSFLWNL